MATNSILHSVRIRKKELATSYVDALEHAQGKTAKDVVLSKTVKNLKVDQIKEIFGE